MRVTKKHEGKKPAAAEEDEEKETKKMMMKRMREDKRGRERRFPRGNAGADYRRRA